MAVSCGTPPEQYDVRTKKRPTRPDQKNPSRDCSVEHEKGITRVQFVSLEESSREALNEFIAFKAPCACRRGYGGIKI